jgi:hypothetical protein
MAEVVGDYDDDPIPPRPRHDEEYSPFEVDGDEAQQQPQLSRIESNISTSSRPREATELDEIRRLSTESTSEGSLSSGEYRIPSRQSVATTTSIAAANSTERRRQSKKWVPGSLRRFWARNVTLEVPHKGNRDYFGTTAPLYFISGCC